MIAQLHAMSTICSADEIPEQAVPGNGERPLSSGTSPWGKPPLSSTGSSWLYSTLMVMAWPSLCDMRAMAPIASFAARGTARLFTSRPCCALTPAHTLFVSTHSIGKLLVNPLLHHAMTS